MASPFDFDPEKVLANARQASDEDLLNRVTVYRAEMESEAVAIIEEELHSRGFSAADIESYRQRVDSAALRRRDGTGIKCTFCHNPAVAEGWDWHRLWGRLPLFPRYFYYCKTHRPAEE